MKQNKTIQTLLCLSALSLVALTGCEFPGGDSSVESEAVSSSPASVDEGGEFIIPEPDTRSKHIEMSLTRSTIPAGTPMYDAAKPIVTLYDGSLEPMAVATYQDGTQYQVIDRYHQNNVYGGGDALPAGEYVVKATYVSGNRKAYATLTVVETNPETASEGHGYHTVSREAIEPYMVGKWSAMGALGTGKTPSRGNPKLLVVPVQFANNAAKFAESEEVVKATLDEVFNADSEDTGWESLKSYYYKASYGQLTLESEITDIYTSSWTTSEYENMTSSAATMVGEVGTWLATTKGYNLRDYDFDKDGFVDGIMLIYATDKLTPSASADDSGSLWWNFTSTVSSSANVSNPTIHRYFWSRWDYVRNSYYGDNTVDAHTIVHESGHMMGLNDYYDYDHAGGPAGMVDMMDQNVGDHNAYSKMLYGWVGPKVIDGSSDEFNITLNSFTDTGDFLLLTATNESGSTWNGMPYDEYLILQYSTPTGVNELDSKGYGEWQAASSTGSNPYGHGGSYEYPGLMVLHVDARLSSFQGTWVEKSGSKQIQNAVNTYTDNLLKAPVYREDGTYESASSAPHQNTPSRSTDLDKENFKSWNYNELAAIFPGNSNGLQNNTSYANSFGKMTNLYGKMDYIYSGDETQEGGYYGSDVFSAWNARAYFPRDLLLDDGSALNWCFNVVDQTDTTITLHFVNTDKI